LALEEKLPKPLFDLLMRTPDASIPTLYRDFGAYDLAQFQTPEPSSDNGGQQLPTEENEEAAEAAEAPEAIELEPRIDPTAEESNGTNFFVFSGKKTTTGNAILAVDPHLPLDAPGLTYPMRIELPGEFIAGAAWVGTPTVVFGQNSHIAWGMTHLYADTFDYIIERVDPENPSQYLTPNGSLPFETENITINVKGGDPVTAVVRKTRNGIVVSDRLGDATPADGLQDQFKIVEDVFGPGHVVVRRQLAGVEGHSTVQALLKMSQARSWQVFQDAVRDYEWTNNIVYADVDGNIGVQFSARLPNREKLNGWNGQRLARGWLGEGQWNGYVPFEDLPTILNPEKGWAADSNGRAIDPEYPVRAEETFSPPWRVSRAYDLIEKSPPLDVDAITKIQTDTVSAKADALLRYLLDLDYANPQSAEAIRRLSEWDRNMDVGRVEPTLYSAIELALQHRILNQWGKPQARDSASAVQLIRVLSSEQRDQWCDDHRTDAKETCQEVITASVDDAMGALSKNLGDDMSEWRWGDHHVVDFNALYSWAFIPVLKDLFAVRVETPGGDSTLNQGASDRELDLDAGLLKTVDFSHDHGASFRLVADLSDPSKSVMSFAPGVSGNALSPHWRDMAEVWARGEYISLLANGGSPKTVTRLVPKER
ncbi:MAG: penicillin acylase family protein, partial [Pseudomonadota bacterium]